MIRLTDVAKEYPRSGSALAEISFQVKKGEFVFLTGPSGSGKTTILKLLYMDDKPNVGEVWVNGVSSLNAKGREISRLRRRLGIVFQDPSDRAWSRCGYSLRDEVSEWPPRHPGGRRMRE